MFYTFFFFKSVFFFYFNRVLHFKVQTLYFIEKKSHIHGSKTSVL